MWLIATILIRFGSYRVWLGNVELLFKYDINITDVCHKTLGPSPKGGLFSFVLVLVLVLQHILWKPFFYQAPPGGGGFLSFYMFSEFSVSAHFSLEGPTNFCLQKSRMPLAGLVYLQLNLPKHMKVYTVACQWGGVSEEPPWLRAAARDGSLTL